MEISEQRRSQWLKQFLHSSHIGILVVDQERKILFANTYLCSMFGYTKEEVLHRSTELFHISPASFNRFSEIAFNCVKEGKPVNIDYPCKHKNGSELWIHISGDLIERQNEILWTVVDITSRVKAEKEIGYLKERLEMAIEANRDVVWDWDLVSNALYVSPRWKEIIGHDNRKTPYEIKIWRRYLHPEDRKKVFQDINDTIAGKTDYLDNIHRIQHHDGHWLWIHIQGKVLFDKEGRALRMIGTHRNITSKKRLQLKIAQQAQMIEQIHESIISTDLEGTILTWNRGSERLFNYRAEEAIGHNITMLFHTKDHQSVHQTIEILKEKGEYHIEATLLKKSHDIIIADLSTSLLRDEKGEMMGMIGYVQDITARKKAQDALLKQKELLHHQANHDSLTRLPNRLYFQNRLEASIQRAKRNHTKMALFFIDLDHFKEINDSLGHDVGDEVLKEVSSKLQTLIRETDTLARLGGDEFTIILEAIEKSSDVSQFATKIIALLSSVMKIGAHELYVSSSIGIGIYPDDGTTTKDLLKYADAAMYKAKEQGRSNFQFYDPALTASAYQRVKIETELREALKHQEFTVHYQPQIDGSNDTLIGFEALVRWNHPEKGYLLPSDFIDLAISTGLIVTLDNWVMQRAMTQFVQWHQANLQPGILAMNLSAKQLYEKNFIEQFQAMMHETGCRAEWIEFEITENQMMQDPEKALHILDQISQLGIALTIDDFGLGYSSFAYLQKLPIRKLKIDQTFIEHVPANSSDASIVKAIITVAKNLQLDIVAEGISTEEQKAFILESGCDKIQGYYYAKALSPEETTLFLKKQLIKEHGSKKYPE